MHPSIFPQPEIFRPERWLQGGTVDGKRLDRYLVCFGKGSRQCLGMKCVPQLGAPYHDGSLLANDNG